MEENTKYPSKEEQYKIYHQIVTSEGNSTWQLISFLMLLIIVFTLLWDLMGSIALIAFFCFFGKITKSDSEEIASGLLEKGELSWENFYKKKEEKEKSGEEK